MNKHFPKVPELFRNRAVAIVYDNDEAGLVGAKKLGIFFKKIHTLCKSSNWFSRSL